MIKRKLGTLRIIGGRWRRRLVAFPDIPGLRPTQDRVRETLFNWLIPYIKGASCLDLFAGSGVLGFEALSRGAKRVTFVDKHPKVISHIQKAAQLLEVPFDKHEIIEGNCLEKLPSSSFYPYNIVFLDPPFHDISLYKVIDWLESPAYLAQSAIIYVEMKKQLEPIELPNWRLLREGHTMNVSYYLLRREGAP